MSQFRQRQIAGAIWDDVETADDHLNLDQIIAKATGTRIVAAGRHRSTFEIPVKVPPINPYHEAENPHGTVSKFDDAVKMDRAYMAHQRKKNRNHRRN